MRIFKSLLLLCASVSVAQAAQQPRKRPGHKCLPSGDESAINKALTSGGKGTSVLLCPGSVHRLASPIRFTSPDQSLMTAGKASGHDRALLIVEGADMATAIFADCKSCGGATISNLAIDGNRPQLLRVPGGGALIEIGNGERQQVTGCRLYEPRGWSALHVREGDSLNCRQAYVANNVIGPCGEEWDVEYDGVSEKDPNWGNPRADGISLACKDSVVEHNLVFDATDGAIVLFGSAGTEVRENHIYSRTRVVLGGINLVDYDPWAGDYKNVKVHRNQLHALGRYFKVGIVVGPSSWIDDTDTTVFGASVTDNAFDGPHFGYAIVVSSASDMTITGNKVAEDTVFSGLPGFDCPTAPENGKPTAFLINRGSASGSYQADFVNGEVQHIICIVPPDVGDRPYRPWRLRDSQAATEAQHALDVSAAGDLETRLTDALVGYQLKLLQVVNAIEDRLDKAPSVAAVDAPTRAGGADHQKPLAGNKGGAALDGGVLSSRMAALESSSANLNDLVAVLSNDVSALTRVLKDLAAKKEPLLKEVHNRVTSAHALARKARKTVIKPDRPRRSGARAGTPAPAAEAVEEEKAGVSGGTYFLLLAVVLAVAGVVARQARRWHRTRSGRKLP